ncbi:beta-microseminoprotein [Gastrophryne carolinensis]
MHHNYKSRSSPMNHLVVITLASGFLIMLCNAICIDDQPRRLRRGEKLDGCMDGDIKRELNSTWVLEDCTECCCTPEGLISCCTEVSKPVSNNPDCESILNKTTCKYEQKRKDGSSKPCDSWAVM